MLKLSTIINFDAGVADLDELYLAQIMLNQLDQAYQKDLLDPPESVVLKLSEINAEIKRKIKADLERMLKLAEAKTEQYASRIERKQAAQVEADKLRERLKAL